MRKLVICRVLLASAALLAAPALAQRNDRGREEGSAVEARDPQTHADSTESAPAPPVEAPSATRDEPAAVSQSESGLSPHYREMEERNQRRYEHERRRDEDRAGEGGTERHRHRDGGDGQGEHRHHRHRYIDGRYEDLGYFELYEDSGTSEEITMPAVGRRFDPEVCSLFTGVSGLLRNMFGDHRCRVLNSTRYGLPAPGPGRLWLRVLKDAVLVDGADGTVVDIVRNAVRQGTAIPAKAGTHEASPRRMSGAGTSAPSEARLP